LTQRETTCCFTGYRPTKLPWGYAETGARYTQLKSRLEDVVDAVYLSGIRHYICGMAQGADTMFCEAVLRLRDWRPGITVEAAIPCEGQSASWPVQAKDRYFRLVSECDRETVLQKKYTPDCMVRRNRYMVEQSSVLIAVYDGIQRGGTMQTVHYAKQAGLEVIQLTP